MTREQAGGRFGVTWGVGVATSLLGQLVELPPWIRIGVGVGLLGLLVRYGVTWLRLAARDGTLRRGVPEYGWAFLSLLLIAGVCGLLSYAVLLVVDDDLTLTDVSTGAALGTVATLVAWWALRGRTRPAD